MHPADYEDSLSQSNDLDAVRGNRAAALRLNKHIEKVSFSVHLRNEYPTIREYNEQAGNIAEKYHFPVIADFPVNFSETALRNLVNIARERRALRRVLCLFTGTAASEVPRFVLDELR